MAINSINALHLQSSVSFSLGLITVSLINSGAYEQTPGSGLRRRCRKAVSEYGVRAETLAVVPLVRGIPSAPP